MKLLEFFMDTKHKRATLLALLFAIMLLKECICNIFFVFPTLSYTTLESLYNLVPYAEYSFIGRLLYSLYSMTEINIPYIVLTILKCISAPMLLSILLAIYYIANRYCDHIFKLMHRLSVATIIMMVIIYGGALTVILKNITLLTTYYTILNAVHTVALWLLVTHIIFAVLLLCFLYFIIKEYLEALEYTAIEGE